MSNPNTFPIVRRRLPMTNNLFPIIQLSENKRAVTGHLFLATTIIPPGAVEKSAADVQAILEKSPYEFPTAADLYTSYYLGKDLGSLQPTAKYLYIGSSSLDLDAYGKSLSSWEAAPLANWIWTWNEQGLRHPINKTVDTHVSKQRTPLYLARSMYRCFFQVYTGFSTPETFDECSMSIVYDKEHGYRSNEIVFDTEADYAGVIAHEGTLVFEMSPTMKLSSQTNVCPAGEIVEYTATLCYGEMKTPLYQEGVEVITECTAGYLPKTRGFTNAAGEVTFKIRALDLEPGDTMRVKIGTKTMTGIADFTFTVV